MSRQRNPQLQLLQKRQCPSGLGLGEPNLADVQESEEQVFFASDDQRSDDEPVEPRMDIVDAMDAFFQNFGLDHQDRRRALPDEMNEDLEDLRVDMPASTYPQVPLGWRRVSLD